MTGQTYTLRACEQDTIAGIKAQIFREAQAPPERQRIVLAGADPKATGWSDFDQRSLFTDEQKARWNRTSFFGLGQCTNYDVSRGRSEVSNRKL